MASTSKLTTTTKPDFLSPQPQPEPQQQQQQPKTHTTTTTPTTAIDNKPSKPPSTMADILSPQQQDLALANSSHLTRQELLRRRLHRVRQLSKVYKDYYWALMEELRVQYREYYWKFGISPYKEDEERENGGESELGGFNNNNNNVEGSGETNNNNGGICCGVNGGGGKLGLGFGESVPELKLGGNCTNNSNRSICTFVGCKLKAMALTNFCHLHILSDPQQKLYKACNYVIKSAQAGPILCGKPILRSTVPSLCNIHFQKSQKHVTRALKKAGLNVSASSKLAPNIHVIFKEYVHHIQSKRRTAQKADGKNIAIKQETS